MPTPLPATYAEAIKLCEELANAASLDPREADGEEVLETECERQEAAVATVARLRETEGRLLDGLSVPTKRTRPSRESLMPADGADMAQVLPALLLTLELAREDVLRADQAVDDVLRHERRRQQQAVALMTDLVTLHRDELSKVVLPEAPTPSA